MKGHCCRAQRPASTRVFGPAPMYIVVIAWIFVALVIAAGQTSVVAGVLSFVFWGMLPLLLLLWLIGTPARLRAKRARLAAAEQQQPDQD